LFDALVAAIAEKTHTDAIFFFDEWYKKVGFTLVTSLTEPVTHKYLCGV
jgi:hypothetical protein